MSNVFLTVYSLSDSAKSSLKEFLGEPEQDLTEGSQGVLGSTEVELPPRYHPLVVRMILALRRSFQGSSQASRKEYSMVSRDSHQGKDKSSGTAGQNENLGTLPQWIRNQLQFFWYLWVQYPFKNPLQFIRIGFSSATPPNSARRWRPLTVLLHLSSSGRNPFSKLLTGLMEGSILLLLTVFFASQWGGNIFVVSYTIAMLLVVVTVGRLMSIVYIWRSAYFLGLHVIDCQIKEQISGCLRILCSMSDVLVVVNGAYYYGGHRLELKPNWAAWRKQYDSGVFDETDMKPSNNRAHESSEEESSHGFERFRIRRKRLGAARFSGRHQEGGGSGVALRDLSLSPLSHSQVQSDVSRDSSMQRAPDASAEHETV